MTNTLAILIPTKNRLSLLKRSLNSIYDREVLPNEVIVVNDGSTDDTKVFLDSLMLMHKNLKVVHREKSGGVNSARNAGVRVAESKWIFFLDDDDEIIPTFMEKGVSLLSKVPESVGIVFYNTQIKRSDTEEFIGGYQFLPSEESYFPTYDDFLLKKNLKGDCKPVFRKSMLIERNFSFSEQVNGFESYDQIKLRKMGVEFVYLKELSTIVHQEHEERLSNTAAAKNPAVFLSLNQHMVSEHYDAYLRHPKALAGKYLDMVRLSLRLKKISGMLKYLLLFTIQKVRTLFFR